MRADLDAVVVGSGPNGLAAAVTMAAAGLRVQVIEGAPTIGGGCRTEELTLPGFWHDVCSASHPLAGGRAAVVTQSVRDTAARLGADGRAYQRLLGPVTEHLDEILAAVLAPLRRPPAHPVPAMKYGRHAI